VPPSAQKVSDHQDSSAQFLWSSAESAIRDLEADLLLIFDCCDAGRLCQAHRSHRYGNFEFLGSCVEGQVTRSAGPHSFTTALIAALTKLSRCDVAFNTSKLQSTISQHGDFPKDQTPVLSDRWRTGEHIVIDRRGLPAHATSAAPKASVSDHEAEYKEHIDIRIHFDCSIKEEHIERTAKHLKEVRDHNKLQISRIDFHGKSSKLEKVARRFIAEAGRQRAGSVVTPLDQTSSEPSLVDAMLNAVARNRAIGSSSTKSLVIENADQVTVEHVNHDNTLAHHFTGIAKILYGGITTLHQWLRIRVRQLSERANVGCDHC